MNHEHEELESRLFDWDAGTRDDDGCERVPLVIPHVGHHLVSSDRECPREKRAIDIKLIDLPPQHQVRFLQHIRGSVVIAKQREDVAEDTILILGKMPNKGLGRVHLIHDASGMRGFTATCQFGYTNFRNFQRPPNDQALTEI